MKDGAVPEDQTRDVLYTSLMAHPTDLVGPTYIYRINFLAYQIRKSMIFSWDRTHQALWCRTVTFGTDFSMLVNLPLSKIGFQISYPAEPSGANE